MGKGSERSPPGRRLWGNPNKELAMGDIFVPSRGRVPQGSVERRVEVQSTACIHEANTSVEAAHLRQHAADVDGGVRRHTRRGHAALAQLLLPAWLPKAKRARGVSLTVDDATFNECTATPLQSVSASIPCEERLGPPSYARRADRPLHLSRSTSSPIHRLARCVRVACICTPSYCINYHDHSAYKRYVRTEVDRATGLSI